MTNRHLAAAGAGLSALGLWAYWPTLAGMARRWSAEEQYSHGYLVPLFAAGVLWLRPPAAPLGLRASAAGLPLLAVALALRVVGSFNFDTLDGLSLVFAVGGLVGLFGGAAALRWAWPGVAFLVFMVPLPHRVETALTVPLQRLATAAGTYGLQTLGVPAAAEGNVITLDGHALEVAAACSGLSMVMTFLALSAAVAAVVERPPLDRAVVLASALPVAVAANVTRITATGLAYHYADKRLGDLVFHDLAGWLMMPFAVAVLAAELWAMKRLLVARPDPDPAAPRFAG